MREKGFDFLFSGEVLGQRPMSQNLSSLRAVAKASGVGEYILRPLSARLLPTTAMEENGLVDRARLLDIQGRTRRRQEELARKWGVNEYASPGGGCLLTEAGFSNRLRDLLDHCADASINDVELLKVGRQFRLSPRARLVVGRNKANNDEIDKLIQSGDYLIQAAEFPGPLGLLRGRPDERDLVMAGAIVAGYGKGREQEEVLIAIRGDDGCRTLAVAPASRAKIKERLIV
jgi:tRNA U34 2-thiouridine synthase MnmA/TrmU